jgi:hypothetical protein
VKSTPCHGPRCFPSGDVGVPHLLADERGEPFRLCERAVYQRTSIPWALPPWSDETPPFTRRSATPCLATNERFLLRASPCPRALRPASRPTGENDASLDHDVPTEFCNTIRRTGTTDTGYCSSPPGARRPAACDVRSRDRRRRRAVSICVITSTRPSRARPPYALLHGSAP